MGEIVLPFSGFINFLFFGMGRGSEGIKIPPKPTLTPPKWRIWRGEKGCLNIDLNSIIINVILNIYKVKNIIYIFFLMKLSPPFVKSNTICPRELNSVGKNNA